MARHQISNRQKNISRLLREKRDLLKHKVKAKKKK
jgi:hypothetical protein